MPVLLLDTAAPLASAGEADPPDDARSVGVPLGDMNSFLRLAGSTHKQSSASRCAVAVVLPYSPTAPARGSLWVFVVAGVGGFSGAGLKKSLIERVCLDIIGVSIYQGRHVVHLCREVTLGYAKNGKTSTPKVHEITAFRNAHAVSLPTPERFSQEHLKLAGRELHVSPRFLVQNISLCLSLRLANSLNTSLAGMKRGACAYRTAGHTVAADRVKIMTLDACGWVHYRYIVFASPKLGHSRRGQSIEDCWPYARIARRLGVVCPQSGPMPNVRPGLYYMQESCHSRFLRAAASRGAGSSTEPLPAI
jgi:hypothetical protein